MSTTTTRVAPWLSLRAAYARLPEELRHCLRPLNLIEEAASFMPATLRAPLEAATSRARRLRLPDRARYTVRRLEGLAPGGHERLVVRLVSDEPSARYWKRTLFAAPPREACAGILPARAVVGDAAAGPGDADLALWQASWPVGRGLALGDVVPSWVPLVLPTARPLDDIVRGERTGRAARKNDVRRVQKLGLEPRITSEADAVDRFRRELYEPYVRRRFGDGGVLLSPHAFRQLRRRGCLLLLERDGVARAGALLEPHGEALRVRAFGAAVDAGGHAGIEACYYHAIALAVERGFARLELGTARPVLTDGVLQYKRKWGAQLASPTTLDRFLLRYRNSAATRAVLTAAPLVVDRGADGLVALVGAQTTDPGTQLSRLDVPGLASLVLFLEPGTAAPRAAPCSPLRCVPAP